MNEFKEPNFPLKKEDKKIFVKLTDLQVQKKIEFIKNYIKASNAAEASQVDTNSNINNKNIHTLECEMNKDILIQINRALVSDKIKELWGEDLAKEYIRQIEDHEIYIHDESSLKPYCVSISMYPFLLDGLKSVDKDGGSKPEHLYSFCGGFINLLIAISSQFAGAVATPEFLMYFDYFARKDLGNNYLDNININNINHFFSQVVYSINQPSVAKGYQSIFWNISIYDKYYFESLFENFVFPDGSKPDYNSVSKLQKYFMKWFNLERTKKLLTFPVITAACLNNSEELKDHDFEDFITTELSEGNSFFIYTDKNAAALSSCCRLRNSIEDQKEFSYTMGSAGLMTGSLNVITLNLNNIAQKGLYLGDILEKVYKYQIAFKEVYKNYLNAGLFPVYDAGYINIDKQFLTIGINGLTEAAEFFGLDISLNQEYQDFLKRVAEFISNYNTKAKKKYSEYNVKFNTEMVPAENLGVKIAKWEKDIDIVLYEVNGIKYPLNTKVKMKDQSIKLIQDLENDSDIEEIIKYSSFIS